MLDRSLESEFESYRKTLSTDEARRAFDARIERLLSQHGVDRLRARICGCSQGCVILESEMRSVPLAAIDLSRECLFKVNHVISTI